MGTGGALSVERDHSLKARPYRDAETVDPNRWCIAIAAVVVMLTLGTVYSWAIFTQPLLVAFSGT